MEETLFNYAFKEGVWAVLFVSLYYYQLKESRRLQEDAKQREDKLTAFIHDITKQFEGLTEQYQRMANDVNDIKCSVTIRKEGRK